MCEDHYRTNSKVWYCKYCNAEFHSRRKLFEHYKVCDIKLSLPTDSLGRVLHQDDACYKCEFCGHISTRKSGLTNHIKYCKNNPNHIEKLGCHHSYETHVRLSRIARKRVGHSANFNPRACEYIDSLNEKMGWHLQHALNGGEITVGPYFLDGYDRELNIAFEYDEARHHKDKVKQHDLVKQKFIISTIGCKFFRYDEVADCFYEVNDQQALDQALLNKKLDKKPNKKSNKESDNKSKTKLVKETRVRHYRNRVDASLKEFRWNLIIESDIDFSKFGWVEKIASIFGISSQKAGAYIRKHFPEFYSNCFVRKRVDEVVAQ